MQMVDIAKYVVAVRKAYDASYDRTAYNGWGRYTADWYDLVEKCGAPKPLWDIIYFLAISGEGADYCQNYLDQLSTAG